MAARLGSLRDDAVHAGGLEIRGLLRRRRRAEHRDPHGLHRLRIDDAEREAEHRRPLLQDDVQLARLKIRRREEIHPERSLRRRSHLADRRPQCSRRKHRAADRPERAGVRHRGRERRRRDARHRRLDDRMACAEEWRHAATSL